jgi:hypothetical protein
VPKDYEANSELDRWVRVQRRYLKKYISEEAFLLANQIIQDRVQKLNELEFDWGTTRSNDWGKARQKPNQNWGRTRSNDACEKRSNDAWEKRYVSVNSL